MNEYTRKNINTIIIDIESALFSLQAQIAETVYELLSFFGKPVALHCSIVTDFGGTEMTFDCSDIRWDDETASAVCRIHTGIEIKFEDLTIHLQFEILQALYHEYYVHLSAHDSDSSEIH